MYFALNSSYSLQDKYSSVDKDGHKHMLVCSVLVGHYTKGNKNMKAAPLLPGKTDVSPHDLMHYCSIRLCMYSGR